MTKTYLAIALLITGFLVGDAYGDEDVYYCSTTASVGFSPDMTNDLYKENRFTLERFKMKYEGRKITKIADSGRKIIMECDRIRFTEGSEATVMHQCTGKDLSTLVWNKKTGFFTLSISTIGLSTPADITSSYGNCTKF
jgi:hypothetical protein